VSQGIRNDSITKQCLCCVSTVQCAVCCASAVVLSLFTLSWRVHARMIVLVAEREASQRTAARSHSFVRGSDEAIVEPAFAALRVTK
jgi:hypothetical protein